MPIEDPEVINTLGEAAVLNVHQITSLPVTARELQEATSKDPVLSRVLDYTLRGWPLAISEEFKSYYQHRNELSVEAGCLLRGMRVIIPQKYRERILTELHSSCSGLDPPQEEATSPTPKSL